MPLYFFHIVTKDGTVLPDDTGVQLPDLDAARQEADRTVASLLRDTELGGRDYTGGIFEVESDDGRQVFAWPIRAKS